MNQIFSVTFNLDTSPTDKISVAKEAEPLNNPITKPIALTIIHFYDTAFSFTAFLLLHYLAQILESNLFP